MEGGWDGHLRRTKGAKLLFSSKLHAVYQPSSDSSTHRRAEHSDMWPLEVHSLSCILVTLSAAFI